MSKYRHHKYTWLRRGDWIAHRWELVGPYGALHFSAQVHDGRDPSATHYEPSCGLECHYAHPPEYMQGQAPSQTDCSLTGGWCWHDGTSLYAMETLWPEFSERLRVGDHDGIFRALEYEADQRFAEYATRSATAIRTQDDEAARND